MTFHLVEDEAFERYMLDLLEHSSRFVVLYTSDSDVFLPKEANPTSRSASAGRSLDGDAKSWRLMARYPNRYPYKEGNIHGTSPADFYVYERDPSDISARA